MTPTDELIMNSKYKNSPRLYFGKILDNFLVNPRPEYGFFQKALTSAMPIFLYKVFLTKSVRGFSVTGAITIPATPVVVIPIIHPASQPIGGLITNTLIPPISYVEVESACRDKLGFWVGLFKLLSNKISNTIITITDPIANGLTYTTPIKSVCPSLEKIWSIAGKAFDIKIKTKQVDDHDYAFMMMSEEIDRLIKTTMFGVISLSLYTVVGGTFTGTINFGMFDYNP